MFLPCQGGPKRLPSSLVRVIVSGLPTDFWCPGLYRHSFSALGTPWVEWKVPYSGQSKAELAAFAPDVMQSSVVMSIVRPSGADTILPRLIRAFEDVSGTVILRVAGGVTTHRPVQDRASSRQLLQISIRLNRSSWTLPLSCL